MKPGAGLCLAGVLFAAPAAAGVPGVNGAAATSPVRTYPLAENQLLVEVGGIGLVTTRADLVTVTAAAYTRADSLGAARQTNEAKVRRLVAAARRAGVPADAIEVRHGEATLTAMTFDVMEEPPPESDDAETGAHAAASTIVIRLRDIERAAAVREALTEAGGTVSSPIYALTDSTEARRAARVQALAMAQADAEAYAAQTNRRIVRLVRLTERIGFDLYGLAINHAALLQHMRGAADPGAPQTRPEIPTYVFLGADYALAPR